MRAFSAALVLALLSGCGSRTTSGVDASMADVVEVPGPDSGEYWQGVYKCCGQTQGTTCCAGIATGLCFAYGGIYGTCRGNGAEFEGKVICAFCCPGLTAVSQEEFVGAVDGGSACIRRKPVSLLICLPCGDGVCAAGENRCNCPADCGSI
jgi:hypothetical protein